MSNLFFLVAAALLLFGVLFTAAAIAAERGLQRGTKFFRRMR